MIVLQQHIHSRPTCGLDYGKMITNQYMTISRILEASSSSYTSNSGPDTINVFRISPASLLQHDQDGDKIVSGICLI